MSTSAITSSILSAIAGSPSTANRFVTDLNQLAKDLQSGNLSAGQDDYLTLSQDALDGATASTATTSSSGITAALLSGIASSSSSSSSFVTDLNQLGADLANGNLSSAQGDMLSLDSTALNAVPSSSAASNSSTQSKADAATLISATIQAMEFGDDSTVGTDMSQLASVSVSSDGAGLIKSASQSYGSAPGSPVSSSQSSIGELLNSSSADSSSTSGSSLSFLA